MTDEEFMKIAIEEAKKGDSPFGAVIVKDGEVISKAHNTLSDLDPTAHAEINAIREACKLLGIRKLNDCILYSVSEPCPMCFGVAIRVGISKIVYGLELEDLPKNLQNETDIKCSILNEKWDNRISIVSGVLKDVCLKLFD